MEGKEDSTQHCPTYTDADRGSYIPFSFRRSALLCTITTTFLLLSIVATLHYLDARHGALLVGSDGDGLSAGQLFQIRYLPIIVIVLYGSWITVLDLDIKRLEPWLQLSSRSETPSSSSLLCRYDTEFILSVLAKSFLSRYLHSTCGDLGGFS